MDRWGVKEKGSPLIAAVIALSLTQPTVVVEYETSATPRVAASCVIDHLRGRRLGFNLMTLRPTLRELGPYWLITIGENIEITVSPSPVGSNVRLKTDVFADQLTAYVAECKT
jgi:hypothetical protein